jgi:hypothetical protein
MPEEKRKLHVIDFGKETLTTHRSRAISGNEISKNSRDSENKTE